MILKMICILSALYLFPFVVGHKHKRTSNRLSLIMSGISLHAHDSDVRFRNIPLEMALCSYKLVAMMLTRIAKAYNLHEIFDKEYAFDYPQWIGNKIGDNDNLAPYIHCARTYIM